MNYHHIRNATAVIHYAGITFLIDPFLSPKGALPSVHSNYNTLKNPLVDLPCSIDDILNDIDAVIVTHMHHFDHFDAVAKAALNKRLPIFTQNSREQNDMRALGFENVDVLSEQGTHFHGVTLYKTKAEHGKEADTQSFYDAKGIPSEASGVLLMHEDEGTLYLAGDTIWNEEIEQTIQKFSPKTIVLNAGRAEFAEDAPILMGTEGIMKTRLAAPSADIIVVHLEAVNHARVTREEVRAFIKKNDIQDSIFVPNDGEIITNL